MKAGRITPENVRKFQLQKVQDMPKHKQILFDKKHHTPKRPNRHFNKKRTFLAGTIQRNIADIDSISKIAYIIYHSHGCGTYNLLFWGYAKNKSFRKQFTCRLKHGKCIHYTKGKCRKWKNLQKGRGCRANPMYSWNFRKRGKITLKPVERLQLSGHIKPYRVVWHTSDDKMGRLRIGFKRDV